MSDDGLAEKRMREKGNSYFNDELATPKFSGYGVKKNEHHHRCSFIAVV